MSPSPRPEARISDTVSRGRGSLIAPTTSSTGALSLTQSSNNFPRDNQPRNAPALPPLATLAGEVQSATSQGNLSSPTPWRSLGVRNILNPASEVQTGHAAPVPPSPQSTASTGQRGLHAIPNDSPRVRKRGEPHPSIVESPAQQNTRPGRRIITAQSPSQRAASAGTHRSPSAGGRLIGRIPLPSGEGHAYTAEPGDSHDSVIPPLPSLSAAAVRGSLHGLQGRDLVSPVMHATAANAPFSATGGPLTRRQEFRQEPPRSAYTSGEPSSSGFPQNQGQMSQSPAAASGESLTNYMTSTPGPVRSRPPYGQAEYQMTFDTQQGPVSVPVHIDVQQASRVADEKRRRNAGASARFRARRKEKEREANQTISGLQQELQELMEEREFYLRERNFFRDMLARNNPGPLPVRPHSPQARRIHPVSSAATDTSPSIDYNRQEVDMPRLQRRRTGEYQSSLTSQSPSTPYNPPFPPPGPPMMLPTLSAPSTFSDPRTGPPGPPPSSSRPAPFDPLRLLDRDWTGGR